MSDGVQEARNRRPSSAELKGTSLHSHERVACLTLIIIAVLLFVLLRLPLVSVPLERDEGGYAYVAQRMLEGDIPYRDAFDQKPPGVYLAYLAAFTFLGQSIEGIHLFLYVWTAATACVLFAFVRRLAGPLAAAFAIFVFAIVTADPRLLANAANTEHFMLLPIVASVYCMIRGLGNGGGSWWFACGALAAAACWFKQTAVTNLLFIGGFSGFWLLFGRTRVSLRSTVRICVLMVLGATACSAPVLIYFAMENAWDPFVDAILRHNLYYATVNTFSQGIEALLLQLEHQTPSFAVFWVLAGITLIFPGIVKRATWTLLIGWTIALIAGLSFSLYFREHYFIQYLPALSALCGISLSAAGHRLLAHTDATVASAGLCALALVTVMPPVYANRDYLRASSPEAVSRRLYGMNPFPESLRIAEYIRQHSGVDDTVYVVGSEPQILFYAKRRSATRYMYFYPLTVQDPVAPERQREVTAEIEANPPLYVVWVHVPTSLMLQPGSESYVFEELWKLLRQDYQLELFAHPAAGTLRFEFVEHSQAKNEFEETIRNHGRPLWIAVFRRTS